jgi:hypothetical protein
MPVLLGKKGAMKIYKAKYGSYYISDLVKPTGKFWKRYFNKKVRKGETHKRGNWHEWC